MNRDLPSMSVKILQWSCYKYILIKQLSHRGKEWLYSDPTVLSTATVAELIENTLSRF
jgi:hypothetical protein